MRTYVVHTVHYYFWLWFTTCLLCCAWKENITCCLWWQITR